MNKKTLILVFTLLLFILSITGCEKKAEEPQYDIYENHDISACGVNDPLRNIEWLKEYCANIKEKQDIEYVHIYIYKVIDKEEYIFEIDVPSSIDYASNKYYTDQYFRDCIGDTAFYWWGDLVHADPSSYYKFFEDKEFISELFHFVKQ